MIVTYQQGDRFSAAVAGGGVIAYALPKAAAAAAICEAIGVTLAEANRLLDNPASPAEWRATFSAAVAADLESLGGEVEAIADRERADKLATRIATLGEMLAEIHNQQAEANRLTLKPISLSTTVWPPLPQKPLAWLSNRSLPNKRQRRAKTLRSGLTCESFETATKSLFGATFESSLTMPALNANRSLTNTASASLATLPHNARPM